MYHASYRTNAPTITPVPNGVLAIPHSSCYNAPMSMRRIWVVVLMSFALIACSPPPPNYATTKLVTERRHTLYENLLKLLPEEQQTSKAARDEARWLADTAYKAAAGISRVNGSNFPGWFGNSLVNLKRQDRGLCWHYQHDMYRELRRRHLQFFRIGCCVRDQGHASEHNCVYIAQKDAAWPHVWVLDAWRWNGRLRTTNGDELDLDDWADLPDIELLLSQFYTEGHKWPIEHWYVLRDVDGKYSFFYSEKARKGTQVRRMYENMHKGTISHPGSLTNY